MLGARGRIDFYHGATSAWARHAQLQRSNPYAELAGKLILLLCIVLEAGTIQCVASDYQRPVFGSASRSSVFGSARHVKQSTSSLSLHDEVRSKVPRPDQRQPDPATVGAERFWC